VLLPAFDVPFLERELRSIGFEHFVRTRHGEPVDLDGLTVTILAFTTPADGPLGDSLIVIADTSARVLNQNDARPGDPDLVRALGPFDAQIVQFSGAIWYPMVYEETPERMRELVDAKVDSQFTRALKYRCAIASDDPALKAVSAVFDTINTPPTDGDQQRTADQRATEQRRRTSDDVSLAVATSAKLQAVAEPPIQTPTPSILRRS
jgi:hypothetical protein